jgi:hypothetical protein
LCISKIAVRFADMTNTLKRAIEKVTALPAETQERIGEELLSHVEKLQRLRTRLEHAAESLDRDGGHEVEMADVIGRARSGYGSA